MNAPIFILGNPRSGTSLLRMMLTCHPNIVIPPECHFFLWLEEKYGKWKTLEKLREFIKDLYNCRKFETWGIEKNLIEARIIAKNPTSYSELISLIYLLYGKKIDKRNINCWGDKNRLWKEKLHIIPKYFPKSRFIHIVRDGRDVACSYKALAKRRMRSKYAPNLPDKIADIALIWRENINFIDKFLLNIDDCRWLVVKYENLIKYTKSELVKLSGFLNVNFSNQMFDYVKLNNIYQLEPAEFLQWKEKLLSRPDTNNIGKFRNELGDEEIKIFESICNDQLRKFGYDKYV